jgi:hypothetical protein
MTEHERMVAIGLLCADDDHDFGPMNTTGIRVCDHCPMKLIDFGEDEE